MLGPLGFRSLGVECLGLQSKVRLYHPCRCCIVYEENILIVFSHQEHSTHDSLDHFSLILNDSPRPPRLSNPGTRKCLMLIFLECIRLSSLYNVFGIRGIVFPN